MGETAPIRPERDENSETSSEAGDCQSNVGRSEHLWLLAGALAAIVGSFILYPGTKGGLRFDVPGTEYRVQLPEVCMSRRVLDVSCPGCGLTRSFTATARGRLSTAWHLNPMGPVLFVICLLQIPYRIVEYFGLFSNNAFWVRFRRHSEIITYACIAGLFAQWAVRLLL